MKRVKEKDRRGKEERQDWIREDGREKRERKGT